MIPYDFSADAVHKRSERLCRASAENEIQCNTEYGGMVEVGTG